MLAEPKSKQILMLWDSTNFMSMCESIKQCWDLEKTKHLSGSALAKQVIILIESIHLTEDSGPRPGFSFTMKARNLPHLPGLVDLHAECCPVSGS